jgi:hypothetical protein
MRCTAVQLVALKGAESTSIGITELVTTESCQDFNLSIPKLSTFLWIAEDIHDSWSRDTTHL